jgi:hypothetical protein
LNGDCVSHAFSSKEDALRQACDFDAAEMRYAFCHGPNDEKIDAITIVKMV